MYGSTGDVAEAIGKALCDNGALLDIRLIENVEEPSPYDVVVVGSAIQSWAKGLTRRPMGSTETLGTVSDIRYRWHNPAYDQRLHGRII